MTMNTPELRLGVNIDHVATIRNARGGGHPSPLRAAQIAAKAGADGITAHLREDRRHIGDEDIQLLATQIDLPLNLEMAATDEMLAIALRHKPHACCLVPEKRRELTTEGGLDVVGGQKMLAPFVEKLAAHGARVSLFINPDGAQISAAKDLGVGVVELHTGTYCEAFIHQDKPTLEAELARLREAAMVAHEAGLEVHAGHGLSFETVTPIAAISQIRELNIGHFLMGEAIFVSLEAAIKEMRRLMDEGRGL